MKVSIVREIAEAIAAGTGGQWRYGSTRGEALVRVAGYADPIRVTKDDVELPEWAKPLAPGIRLDVQAILADR